MTTRLEGLDPNLGHSIRQLLEEQTGQEVNFILIAFPNSNDDPQPAFLTNFPPFVTESIIQQLAEQMGDPDILASRSVMESRRH